MLSSTKCGARLFFTKLSTPYYGKFFSIPYNIYTIRTTEPIIRKQSTSLLSVYEATKQITMENVKSFAELTDDSNPIHLESVGDTRIPIVHGAFLMSLVAGVMGSHFPGPGSIVISQEMTFLEACPVGKSVNIKVEMVPNDKTDSIPRRRKISDCSFSCCDASNYSICYMRGKARLRIKSN